jgi:DhnA family fructose-bisphosphate aldolase class Ia
VYTIPRAANIRAPVEIETLQIMARTAAQCVCRGLPLLVEALPCSHPNIPDVYDAEAITLPARIAVEHGTDSFETTYNGEITSFRRVVQTATGPLLVLGGEQMNTEPAVLERTSNAMAAGAAGMAMRRNIGQAARPAVMVRALAAIIHDGATVEWR